MRMFEWLQDFRVVLVSGPQRSGTTICAHMVAHDTGKRYVDEEEFANDYRNVHELVHTGQDVVVQCPALSHKLHEWGGHADVAILFMVRETAEIIASQERIGWTWEAAELAKYKKGPADGPICEVKLHAWRDWQSPQVRHGFEVEYYALETHPLWVPEAIRRAENWAARQTASGENGHGG